MQSHETPNWLAKREEKIFKFSSHLMTGAEERESVKCALQRFLRISRREESKSCQSHLLKSMVFLFDHGSHMTNNWSIALILFEMEFKLVDTRDFIEFELCLITI